LQFNREVEALEHEVKRLEQDLSVARQAESHLEVQKQENLQLKETIDRMRFELDEAKSTAQGHSRGVTGSSGAPTLSRNLGAEISRRLVEAEEEEEEEDSYVETVVTRQRTRVSFSGPDPKLSADHSESRKSFAEPQHPWGSTKRPDRGGGTRVCRCWDRDRAYRGTNSHRGRTLSVISTRLHCRSGPALCPANSGQGSPEGCRQWNG
jgi:hypothetical protein